MKKIICNGLLGSMFLMLTGCTGPNQFVETINGAIAGAVTGDWREVVSGAGQGFVRGTVTDIELANQAVVVIEQAPVPVVTEEGMAVVEYGSPCYEPLPEYVVAYGGTYEYYTYENVGGSVNLVYWHDGRRVHSDRRWNHGKKMSAKRWEKQQRVAKRDSNRHEASAKKQSKQNGKQQVSNSSGKQQQAKQQQPKQQHQAKQQAQQSKQQHQAARQQQPKQQTRANQTAAKQQPIAKTAKVAEKK